MSSLYRAKFRALSIRICADRLRILCIPMSLFNRQIFLSGRHGGKRNLGWLRTLPILVISTVRKSFKIKFRRSCSAFSKNTSCLAQTSCIEVKRDHASDELFSLKTVINSMGNIWRNSLTHRKLRRRLSLDRWTWKVIAHEVKSNCSLRCLT